MITWDECRTILGIHEPLSCDAPLVLENISHDSRLVTESDLFIPMPSSKGSIMDFVRHARERGCRAIVIHASMAYKIDAPNDILAIVPDFYQALALLYPLFYKNLPEHRLAITGTDGKTSTCHLLHQLWTLTGIPNATIGTMGFFSNPKVTPPIPFPQGMTTPPQPRLYKLLSWYKEHHDINHVIFEASSHALAQSRLDPLRITVAMFTNFSQDHLDYHSTLYAYWRAKWTLFTDYMVTHAPCYALIHNSIPISLADQERIAPNVSVIRYGHYSQSIPGAHNATYRIVDTSAQGQMVEFHVMDQTWLSWVPLLGVFQISNVLGALIAFACSGGNLATVIPALSHLKPLLGRMEYICTYNGAHIYVDYAHTPQGLTLALQALRPCTKGKLGVVFGCGGDRDGSKRPLMGNVAAMYSDWAIVTDDNPRSEDPAMIRQHVLVGCPRAQSISPRQEALRQAMACLEPGDCLLIAGKGHETTQIIGSHVLPYSDQECVRRYGNITQ